MIGLDKLLRLNPSCIIRFCHHQVGAGSTLINATRVMSSDFTAPGPLTSHLVRDGNMSRIHTAAASLLKKRLAEKPSVTNLAEFQFIGGNSDTFSPSLLVSSEGHQYLFNCGEGLQRICYSNKISLVSLRNVFLTHVDWSNVSGIYGLSLTLKDIGCPHIRVHASASLNGLFEASKNALTFDTGIQCTTADLVGRDFEDRGIHIQPIVIEPKSSISSEDSLRASKKRKHVPKSFVYVCTLPDLPGALDPIKCKDMKVPVGPMLGQLKSGQDITLEDGTIVRSADVCRPKVLGLKFAVIDCPSVDYAEQLYTDVQLDAIRKSQLRPMNVIIHYGTDQIINSSKYQEWMEGFGGDCKHFLVLKSDRKSIDLIEVYRFQYLLNKLDSLIFPTLYLAPELIAKIDKELSSVTEIDHKISDSCLPKFDDTVKNQCDYESLGNRIEVKSLDKFVFRPHKTFERRDSKLCIDARYREASLLTELDKDIQELRTLQNSLPETKDYEPEVVFLGTGSAIPSKYRNTSCILVNFYQPEARSVILDCGEDSYGQLARFYGPARLAEVLKQLKLIYISHQHADHHVGLTQIIKARRDLTSEPLVLMLPPEVDGILKFYNTNFDDISDAYKVVSTLRLRKPHYHQGLPNYKQDLLKSLDGLLEDCELIKVDHCYNSCAVLFRFKIGHPDMDSFSLCYSGDARPSEEFARVGSGCDLLIHEATCDDRSLNDALLKRHSTTREAIELSRQMNAKFTILTHFSQRFGKIPYLTKDFDDKIGIAFDNLCLRCPSQLGRLPMLRPIFEKIFKKDLDDIETKHVMQELRQRRVRDIIKLQSANSN